MERYETHIRQVIQSSLQKAPEGMLEDCLQILIRVSGATGGSILGEDGAGLNFLFSDVESLIGMAVPWNSIAGSTVRENRIIYTYAPSDSRHYHGVDEEIAKQTRYLLSIPIPSVHRSSEGTETLRSAGALQLLFDENIFPRFDVSEKPKEFGLEAFREEGVYAERLREVFWILPNLSFGLEVMRLRQTSYQAIHELKNKLIAASSWLHCLKEDIDEIDNAVFSNEEIIEDYDLSNNAIEEGANLAKSYLQFTKLYNPRFEEVQLNDIVKRSAASVRSFGIDQAEDGAFSVVTELNADIPSRSMDPNQIQMALFNLGKNAAEALLEHGTETPEVRYATQIRGNHSCIIISDNGPGMPEDIAQNLFKPFKTKKEGGTGLGLTITKKIIDIHGGIITCETGGTGTTFTIQF